MIIKVKLFFLALKLINFKTNDFSFYVYLLLYMRKKKERNKSSFFYCKSRNYFISLISLSNLIDQFK